MSYLGGKLRHGKAISEAIKNKLVDVDHNYTLIEPFCGMLGVSRHFKEYEVYSSDNNDDLIFILKELKNGNLKEMPIVTREMFNEFKINKNDKNLSIEKSFALVFCSYLRFYAGSFVDSVYINKKGRPKNYHKEVYDSLKRLEPMLSNIEFSCKNYEELTETLKGGKYVVYCDPPYKSTANCYKHSNFDSEKFWKTMELWKGYGNHIFVSELECPLEHELIYEKNLPVCISKCKKTMNDKVFYLV